MSKSTSGRAHTAPSSKRPQNSDRSPTRRDRSSRRNPDDPRPKTGASRVAALRARHPVAAALVPVGLVLAVVATMVVVKIAGGSSTPAAGASHLATGGQPTSASTGTVALPQSIVAALDVTPSTLDAVGSPSSVVPPSRITGQAIARDADGKPLITYVGAEYCPYCAAERWALAVALSRFGTFSNLSGTHSSSQDVYPDTQTLSFYGSRYTSAYVDFQSVEETTNQAVGGSYATLQTPTTQESTLLSTYDSSGSIPFLDIANRYVITGASYSPQVLQGLSRAEIAGQLDNPKSAVAQAIDGTANQITAAIVAVTGNQPSSVAASPVIASIAKGLGA